MWPTLDRARRRLTGSASAPDASPGALVPSPDATGTPPTPVVRRVEDVVIILGSIEVDQLRGALELALGDAVERPDTPARIERALSILLTDRHAPGKAHVLRRPAGLSTPESWEIHLAGVDRATGVAVREASRTGILAS
jgi:hypothetical protein